MRGYFSRLVERAAPMAAVPETGVGPLVDPFTAPAEPPVWPSSLPSTPSPRSLLAPEVARLDPPAVSPPVAAPSEHLARFAPPSSPPEHHPVTIPPPTERPLQIEPSAPAPEPVLVSAPRPEPPLTVEPPTPPSPPPTPSLEPDALRIADRFFESVVRTRAPEPDLPRPPADQPGAYVQAPPPALVPTTPDRPPPAQPPEPEGPELVIGNLSVRVVSTPPPALVQTAPSARRTVAPSRTASPAPSPASAARFGLGQA